MKRCAWNNLAVVLPLLLLCVIACKDDAVSPIPEVPVLSSLEVESITTTGAISGGIITDDGSSTITARGLCWGTTPAPTILDSKTTEGTGKGEFTSSLTSLTRNTVYYVRAYATNSVGTAYGDELSFKTFEVIDIDGNGYYSVTIGSQVWLTENLRVEHYRNGEPIPQVDSNSGWGNLTTGAYCYLRNDASKANELGLLYNWYAVADSRNISPPGWHVSTDSEWETLINHLGGKTSAGGKLKEAGTAHWFQPNIATNDTGFSGISGGQRALDGEFYGPGVFGCFWTSSEESETAGRDWFLYNADETATRYYDNKKSGFNVRCIKD
jgi:uncharacterized protein (TIGR02145 family)